MSNNTRVAVRMLSVRRPYLFRKSSVYMAYVAFATCSDLRYVRTLINPYGDVTAFRRQNLASDSDVWSRSTRWKSKLFIS